MELKLFTPHLFYFLFVFSSFPVLLSLPPFLGIHPLDEKYFSSEVIKCRDGSSSFPRDRLNDDFCDCTDGTDEPGTSACPTAKFYCRNVGSTPRFLFSSRVNDQICDCCDGSDEYDSTVNCPNICVMGGNIMYKTDSHRSTISNQESGVRKEIKNKIYSEDLIDKLKGLKIVISVQVGIIILWVVSRSAYRRFKSRRRRHR